MIRHGIWHSVARQWAVRVGILSLVALWFVLLALSWANAEENQDSLQTASDLQRSPAAYNGSGDSADAFNFNWLDPEKKIYVLQNRKYLKSNRPLLSVMAGPSISNAYRKTFDFTGAFAYYPEEIWGLEVFYTLFANQENNTFAALTDATKNVIPVIREIRSQFGIDFHYVPWYSKINVFNQILYFDWYFSGGLGAIHTALDTRASALVASVFQNEDFFSLFAGTGQQYHLSRSLLFRIDFTGAFYQAPRFGNSGGATWFSNFSFGFGLGLKI